MNRKLNPITNLKAFMMIYKYKQILKSKQTFK